MSVADALMIMIAFGNFILTLIDVVIIIFTNGNEKTVTKTSRQKLTVWKLLH